jgi:VanZ family protein
MTGRGVLSDRQTRYLTITTGGQGTRLYVDGAPVAANDKLNLSIPTQGNPLRLVLGNSVHGNHVWQGDFHGLVISAKALSPEAVRLNFDRWANARNFDFLMPCSAMLLYTFDRDIDARLSDRSGNGNDLTIPERLVVLQKTILAPLQRQLHLNRAAVGDMVVNVVGFIPVGIAIYGFLQCFSGPLSRRSLLLAVVLCMLLSLGIELAQAWIPTRHSSLQDLILNIFGAWIGIVGWRILRAKGRN